MKGKHCRLYDENLVYSIMASTGISVMEFLKERKSASAEDIYEYVGKYGRKIIEATIEDINSLGENSGRDIYYDEENLTEDE